MKTFYQYLSSFIFIFLALQLTSCSGGPIGSAFKSMVKMDPAQVWLEKVRFSVADDVNDDAPVTVHLLIVYDEDLLDKLNEMTSDQYFEKAKQLERDNAGRIDFLKWEIVPGHKFEEKEISPSKVSGVGVVIFARYSTPGDHRHSLSDEREILIKLEKLDFSIERVV